MRQVGPSSVRRAALTVLVFAGASILAYGIPTRGAGDSPAVTLATLTRPVEMVERSPTTRSEPPAVLNPSGDFATTDLLLASQSPGSAVLHLTAVSHAALDAAAVISVELQDGHSEPVRPTIADDVPWALGAGETVVTEVEFEGAPDGPYKVEALFAAVDETGSVHNSLAETYLVISGGVATEYSFSEWLPLVNVSESVLDPDDPDPEANEED